MNKKTLITLAASILLAVPLFAGSQDNKTQTTDLYEISFPHSWITDTSKVMGTDLILFSPLVGKNDVFRENVNILVQDLSAYDLSLDQYVDISVNQINTLITDSKIELNERVKGINGDFYKIIYTGKQGKLNLKFEQYFWLVKKTAYVLTFTCEVDQFSKYQQVGEQILNSFKLK
ncbi:MAG: hypothetical protein ACJA0Q_000274 [Saprospiraceae bacterium]|jgi:hypothetical protein